MTLSAAHKAARADAKETGASGPRSMAESLAVAFEAVAGSRKHDWAQYRKDPCLFAEDILGLDLTPWQREILLALVVQRLISVRSGHRVGKTLVDAVAALWFFCCFPRARVFLCGPTKEQIEDVLWLEILVQVRRSGCCLDCRKLAEAENATDPEYPKPCPHSAVIEGTPHSDPSDGFTSEDFRQIKAVAPNKPEALQGRAGPAMLFIVDEASGVDEDIYRVIESNLAGQFSRLLMTSNPTRTSGTFYESQTSKKHLYRCFHVSSLLAVALGKPGMASQEWVDSVAAKHGKDSAEYIIRVLGNYPPESSNAVISRALIDNAQARWGTTPDDGPLYLGVDVAEFGDDNTVIAPRRGRKVFEPLDWNGLSSDEVVEKIVGTAADLRREPRELVYVTIDGTGKVGIPVVEKLQARNERFLRVNGLHMGEKARLPREFHSLRDQIHFTARDFLRDGGALPPNEKLAEELHAPTYHYDKPDNRFWVESKDYLRKRLKRSPDLADAVLLSIWEEERFSYEAQAIPSPGPYAVKRSNQARIYGAVRQSSYGGTGMYGSRRR